ncbi:hypothetical protein STEG23_034705 [Scotinomys teguina]
MQIFPVRLQCGTLGASQTAKGWDASHLGMHREKLQWASGRREQEKTWYSIVYMKTLRTVHVGEDVEQEEHFSTVGGNADWALKIVSEKPVRGIVDGSPSKRPKMIP